MGSWCSQLYSEGVGPNRKCAEVVVTCEDEQCLWEKGVMVLANPCALLFNVVFFYVRLHFYLRGGQEHQSLSPDRFQIHPEDVDI